MPSNVPHITAVQGPNPEVAPFRLKIDGLDLLTAAGTDDADYARRSVGVPGGLAAALNGTTGTDRVTIAADDDVLRRAAQEVYLIVRYSIA
jgi:hypothetical protein